MLNRTIQFVLILLFIFTPIAFGSVGIWAFSLMELGILLVIILWSIDNIRYPSKIENFNKSAIRNTRFAFPILILFVFLALILFQMSPIPSGMLKVISPRTYELRQVLSIHDSQSFIQNSKLSISFMPLATKIEFYKWFMLSGFFLFLLYWGRLEDRLQTMHHFLVVVLLMGVVESLYGMFEFFSGHHQILYLKGITSVTGTFINRNYFAGYLLMVIPLSMGLFFSREALQARRFKGWRQRLSSLDGKTVLMGFGIIVMILGLIFSGSRMGILSLVLSFTLISFVFKVSKKGRGFSKTSILILGLALLWAVWIGLDTVIGRFFSLSEDFKSRWTIWEDAFKIVRDFPVLGSGLGTFAQIFPMYRTLHMRNLITHAENDFLQLASEVGLMGLGILFVLFIFLFFKAVSGIRSISSQDSNRYIGIGGLAGILALMFHSLVERNLQIPANAFLYTFLWALVLKTTNLRQGAKVVRGD
jgi:O-antigen ligase